MACKLHRQSCQFTPTPGVTASRTASVCVKATPSSTSGTEIVCLKFCHVHLSNLQMETEGLHMKGCGQLNCQINI